MSPKVKLIACSLKVGCGFIVKESKRKRNTLRRCLKINRKIWQHSHCPTSPSLIVLAELDQYKGYVSSVALQRAAMRFHLFLFVLSDLENCSSGDFYYRFSFRFKKFKMANPTASKSY